MADIICPRCGEPWEVDMLAEEAAARREEGDKKATALTVARQFWTEGCGVTMSAYGFGRQCTQVENERTVTSAAMFELLGDDLDGIANETEDWLAMGGV